MDGWITIGTKLDSKQLQRDLSKLENELKKYEKQAEKLTEQEAKIKTKVEFDDQDYRKKVKDLNGRLREEYAKNTKFGYVVNQEQIDLKYDRLRENLDIMHAKRVDQNNLRLEEIHGKMQENNIEQQKLNDKIQETTKKLNKTKGSFDLKGTIENIGNSISKVTKKVVRWGLAVFGVRSAYYFVRQAMSTLSQYDEQLATDIEYIRFALATTLKPLIEKIIQIVYKLLNLLGIIGKKFFGKNIFENAGIDKFQESLNSSNKSAKELKKTLAGFDEMNVLNEDGSVSSLGGFKVPSHNLSETFEPDINFANISNKIQEFLKKVKSRVNEFLTGLKEDLTNWFENLGLGNRFTESVSKTIDGIKEMFNGTLDSLNGFFEIVTGIFTDNTDLIRKGIEDMISGSIENLSGFSKTIDGIFGTIANGIIEAFRKLPSIIKKIFFDKEEVDFNNFEKKVTSNFDNISKKIGDFFSGLFRLMGYFPTSFNSILEVIKRMAFELGRQIGEKFHGIFRDVINQILNFVETRLNTPIRAINILVDGANKILGTKKVERLNPIKLPRLAQGGIINMPSRGVPIGGAIGGESGKEGVIPLTDSQQMALLGEAIGKYITINANITNSMNGRVISRELKRIQNQDDFAMNR